MNEAVNKLKLGSQLEDIAIQNFAQVFAKFQLSPSSLTQSNLDDIAHCVIENTDSEGVIEIACELLWNIVFATTLQSSTQIFNLIGTVMPMYKRNQSIIKSLCGILSSLCTNDARRELVGIHTLQSLCDSLEKYCRDFSLVPFILDAISCCCASNGTNVEIVSSLNVVKLVASTWQMNHTHNSVVKSACHCLAILSDYDIISNQLFGAGCISCLLTTFRNLESDNGELLRLAIIVLLRSCHENTISIKQLVGKCGVRDLLSLVPMVMETCETDILSSYMQLIYACTSIKLFKKLSSAFIEKQMWEEMESGNRKLLVVNLLRVLQSLIRNPDLIHGAIQAIINCVLLCPIIRELEEYYTSSQLCNCCLVHCNNATIIELTIEYIKLAYRRTSLSTFTSNVQNREHALFGLLICANYKSDDVELVCAALTCNVQYMCLTSFHPSSEFLRLTTSLVRDVVTRLESSMMNTITYRHPMNSTHTRRSVFDITRDFMKETLRLMPQESFLIGLLSKIILIEGPLVEVQEPAFRSASVSSTVSELSEKQDVNRDSIGVESSDYALLRDSLTLTNDNSIEFKAIGAEEYGEGGESPTMESKRVSMNEDELSTEQLAGASSPQHPSSDPEFNPAGASSDKPILSQLISFSELALIAQNAILTENAFPETLDNVAKESFSLIFPPARAQIVYENYRYPMADSHVSETTISNGLPKLQTVHCFPNFVLFDSSFESSNLMIAVQRGEFEYDLFLRPDTGTRAHSIWYYFGIQSNFQEATSIRFNIVNISKPNALYVAGMRPLVFSRSELLNDKACWKRCKKLVHFVKNDEMVHVENIPSVYQNLQSCYTLSFEVEFAPGNDASLVCHSFPYTYSDHKRDLELFMSVNPLSTKLLHLRRIQDKFDLYALAISNKVSECQDLLLLKKNIIFISARVHPAETPGSWVMRGMTNFLVSDSEEAVHLRENYLIVIVSMLNPDGVATGNTRCNLHGVDLNRQWKSPSTGTHESIFAIKQLMKCLQSNVGEIVLYMDLHGHNRRCNSFFYGCSDSNPLDHNPRYFPRLVSMNSTSQCFLKYEDCTFDIKPDRDTTARAIVFKELGIPCSYTLETSFFGSNFGKNKGKHYTPIDLQAYGHSICSSIFEFVKHCPELAVCPYNDQTVLPLHGLTLFRCVSPDIQQPKLNVRPNQQQSGSCAKPLICAPPACTPPTLCVTANRGTRLPFIAPKNNIDGVTIVFKDIIENSLRTSSLKPKTAIVEDANESIKDSDSRKRRSSTSPVKRSFQPVKPTATRRRSFRSEFKKKEMEEEARNELKVGACMQIQTAISVSGSKKPVDRPEALNLDESVGKLSHNSQMSIFTLSSYV